MSYQVVALCIKGGNVIGFGVNRNRYVKNKSVFGCAIHAEVDLLHKLRDKAHGSKIYMYRFNNSTSPTARENKNGKPCALCQHALREAGVSRVVYQLDSGETATLKKRDMIALNAQPSNITESFMKRRATATKRESFSVKQYISENE